MHLQSSALSCFNSFFAPPASILFGNIRLNFLIFCRVLCVYFISICLLSVPLWPSNLFHCLSSSSIAVQFLSAPFRIPSLFPRLFQSLIRSLFLFGSFSLSSSLPSAGVRAVFSLHFPPFFLSSLQSVSFCFCLSMLTQLLAAVLFPLQIAATNRTTVSNSNSIQPIL